MTKDISPPATPPTFSPIPHRLSLLEQATAASGSSTDKETDLFAAKSQLSIIDLKNSFQLLSPLEKQYFLLDIINSCDNSQLTWLNNIISPRLKVDFIKQLPAEIALHILSFVDLPVTLTRATCVSKYWRSLIRENNHLWKNLCIRHNYYKPTAARLQHSSTTATTTTTTNQRTISSPITTSTTHATAASTKQAMDYLFAPTPIPRPLRLQQSTKLTNNSSSSSNNRNEDQHINFRDYFKRKFTIDKSWKKGGKVTTIENGFSQGLVTSLQFDEKFIVVGCDNHRIEVFDTATGKKVRTLEGHEGGVWALQFKGGTTEDPERVLLSGGCDRDVRVWDLNRGRLRYVLRGHTSTVRCLKMRDKQLAVTGSRDTTLRVWDISRGTLNQVLLGHQAAVRCIDIHGDMIVSGSYDSTARIWDINTGQCKHVLIGHVSQIYAIVTNGNIIATGSMDAHIRVWSAQTGECLATLHGHTSLVGQLQLSTTTLVSGGADGCLRVWDMNTYECLQQFSAHDNSITCLQFDEENQHILSAANDGKVKLWDMKKGQFTRHFTQPSKLVWKIQFNSTKAVIVMQRLSAENPEEGKTVMEIHDFDLAEPEQVEEPVDEESTFLSVSDSPFNERSYGQQSAMNINNLLTPS